MATHCRGRSEGFVMDLGLKDKVAIIGGASKGLGRACAQVMSEEGAKVRHLQPHRSRPGAGGR